MNREEQVAEFMGWLFRDGGLEPPRREYDAVAQRLRLLVNPLESEGDYVRRVFSEVRRRLVLPPEHGADSIDAAIGSALNDCEERVMAALYASNTPRVTLAAEALDEEAAQNSVRDIGVEAMQAERQRMLVFVRALISEATRPTGRRLDNRWLDEVVADLTSGQPATDSR